MSSVSRRRFISGLFLAGATTQLSARALASDGTATAWDPSTGYAAGRPLAGHFSQLGLPLLAECPKVEVVFVDSNAQPFDPGELGVVAVAPAIANALHSATGLRLRRLPLLSEGV